MDDYENDDVEIVFESLRAAREQRDRQAHDELLASFYHDGLRIAQLDTFDPKQWDPQRGDTMSAESLVKARATRERNQRARQRAQLKQAQNWLRLMKAEVQARANYMNEDEPRAKERKRKYWLHVRDDWHAIGTPRDEALREARKLERTDR